MIFDVPDSATFLEICLWCQHLKISLRFEKTEMSTFAMITSEQYNHFLTFNVTTLYT